MARATNYAIAEDYLSRKDGLSDDELADALSYKWFRLNTLYKIKDKSGKKILFIPNAEQTDFYLNFHCLDIILKARQLGFTTFKMIDDLDNCLFKDNFSAGCICQDLTTAKDIYRNKIRYAYQNIGPDVRGVLRSVGYALPDPVNDKDNSYIFDNGSSIQVSTSFRGGTLQSLHVSEFGKICKKTPEKAKEIVTGAFESVAIGNIITVESTAEGKEGYFYQYCDEAKKLKDSGGRLSALDFNFHFYSWWQNSDYSIDVDQGIPDRFEKYFDGLLSRHGIELSNGQKQWYIKKEAKLGDDIKREYPSIPSEAFEAAIEGAYYAKQMGMLYKNGWIGDMPENEAPVNTAWDLGVGDSTAIWFWQNINGKHHIIDYYENSGEGMRHYFKVLKDKGYNYGTHYAPHDISHREFGADAKSRLEIARDGFEIDGEVYRVWFEVLSIMSIDEGIDLVREILPLCRFDGVACEQGIGCLESYRKEWNDKLGCWRDRPLHDWASHGADGFRYLATAASAKRHIVNTTYTVNM